MARASLAEARTHAVAAPWEARRSRLGRLASVGAAEAGAAEEASKGNGVGGGGAQAVSVKTAYKRSGVSPGGRECSVSAGWGPVRGRALGALCSS